MNEKRIKIVRFILVSVIMLSIFLMITGELTNNFAFLFQPKNTDVLVIYHWWTSPGEQAALGALIDSFSKKYPSTDIISTPITGGAGYSLLDVIQPLVKAGESLLMLSRCTQVMKRNHILMQDF